MMEEYGWNLLHSWGFGRRDDVLPLTELGRHLVVQTKLVLQQARTREALLNR